MKTTRYLSYLVMGLALSAGADSSKTDAKSAPSMDQEKMMKAMEAAGQVTENHKALDYLAGEWNTKTRFWMSAKDKPQESTGKSRFESVFDGKFMKETVEGTAMGRPFQGMAIMGYDNTKKKYVTTWIDNMSTSTFRFEGDSPDMGKTINTSSEFVCPMTGQNKQIRATLKKVSKNKVQYEHYEKDPATGKEFKAMEVVYTRG